ncbi:hypothetical protein PIB30_022396 [Stylosanthes scabra]|uniref:Uncharacterized protein n=1 Tax=Stylosanthes scabra TaxID=79078 RepID=A0ABU6Y850_9FABA|nr:hypothetical protein [Stylosanthes scabra]
MSRKTKVRTHHTNVSAIVTIQSERPVTEESIKEQSCVRVKHVQYEHHLQRWGPFMDLENFEVDARFGCLAFYYLRPKLSVTLENLKTGASMGSWSNACHTSVAN